MHPDIARMFDLSGKVALITGGARHLGFDAACTLAAAGCSIAITSRDLDRAVESAAQLRERYSVEAIGFALDQTDPKQVASVSAQVAEWKSHLDILVNNAGGGSGNRPGILFERTAEDAATLIETNITWLVHCGR